MASGGGGTLRFRCSCCGELHEGLADLAFEAPYYYYTVPETERERRCTLGPDLCSIDGEDHFVRGCLEIPILGHEEPFAWGAWCSLSPANFARYKELFDEPHQSREGPFFGWFSSALPGYPETLGLKVMVHLRDHGARPRFELEPTDHPLAVDFRQGISEPRLQRIYEASLHPAGPGA
jgi:hypothetical protein